MSILPIRRETGLLKLGRFLFFMMLAEPVIIYALMRFGAGPSPDEPVVMIAVIGGFAMAVGTYFLFRNVWLPASPYSAYVIEADKVVATPLTQTGLGLSPLKDTIPMSSFTGVHVRKFSHKSVTKYYVELVHPDKKKIFRAGEFRDEESARSFQHDIGRTLRLAPI